MYILLYQTMEWPLRIQGRLLKETDVIIIREWLLNHPNWCRSRLSIEICQHWGWRRPDGYYKNMACSEMLRKLEVRSLITLPPRRTSGPGRLPRVRTVDVDQTMIRCPYVLKA